MTKPIDLGQLVEIAGAKGNRRFKASAGAGVVATALPSVSTGISRRSRGFARMNMDQAAVKGIKVEVLRLAAASQSRFFQDSSSALIRENKNDGCTGFFQAFQPPAIETLVQP